MAKPFIVMMMHKTQIIQDLLWWGWIILKIHDFMRLVLTKGYDA